MNAATRRQTQCSAKPLHVRRAFGFTQLTKTTTAAATATAKLRMMTDVSTAQPAV